MPLPVAAAASTSPGRAHAESLDAAAAPAPYPTASEGDPHGAAATLALARGLMQQSRMLAVETLIRGLFARAHQPVDVVTESAELLAGCGRIEAAAELCDNAIVAGSDDARLHACAARLDLRLGAFARARERSLFALARDARALEWGSARVLVACRDHIDADDADFDLLRCFLQRPHLAAAARASVLFALGKAHEDVGDVPAAVRCLREANLLSRRRGAWSRQSFRREIAARLRRSWPSRRVAIGAGFTPVFIVGAPCSGAEAVASLLASPDLCDRGASAWLPRLAAGLGEAPDTADLDRAAAAYVQALRQDDTAATVFLDRQPVNSLHLDLVAALFPSARVIHCERDRRDTALSLWMQGNEPASHDFADIAALLQGYERMLANAREHHGLAILSVRHEDLLARPAAHQRLLRSWIGLPDEPCDEADLRAKVPALPVGRWRAYAPHLPQLLAFEND